MSATPLAAVPGSSHCTKRHSVLKRHMTAPCRISGMGQSVYTAAPLSSSAAVYSSKRAMAFKKPLPFSVSQNAAVRCFPCFSTLSGGYCGIFYRKWLKTCINCINPCKKRHLTVSASQYAGSPSRLKCCFPQLCRVFSGKHRHYTLVVQGDPGSAEPSRPYARFLHCARCAHGGIAAKRPLYACCARCCLGFTALPHDTPSLFERRADPCHCL